MKIILFSPPADSIIRSVIGTTGPPLGLAYLASIARDRGHEVKIVDSIAEDLTISDLRKTIETVSPDLIGITSTTSMMPDTYELARVAKSAVPDVQVAVGGPHVTFAPEETFSESRDIDYIIRGEGETVFSELIEALEKRSNLGEVKGLSFRDGDRIRNNPPQSLIKNLDDIPMPAWDLLPMSKYRINNQEFATIVTSRGCPYSCNFCSSSQQFGKQWRSHSPERIAEEIKELYEKYGKREIEFLDDTFTLDLKRAKKVTDIISSEGIDISWSASARVNLFNEEIADSMKRAGAHTVYFGIESGSQKTLDFIGKGINPAMAKLAVKKAKKVGLRTLGSFVIGFPDETIDDVKNTLSFSRSLGVTFAQFTIATPYPGTQLWNYAKERDLINTIDWKEYTTLSPVMKLKNFTSKQILRWLGKAYVQFYMRPSFMLKDIIRDHGFIFKRIIPYAREFLASKTIAGGEVAGGV